MKTEEEGEDKALTKQEEEEEQHRRILTQLIMKESSLKVAISTILIVPKSTL